MWFQSDRTTRLVFLILVLGIALVAVPAAQANHPDVLFARAVATSAAAQATTPTSPDAFMRGVESLRRGSAAPRAFERALRAATSAVTVEPASQPVTTRAGFHWDDFGIGAGAGIAVVLIVGGLGVALGARGGMRRMTSA